MRVRMVYIVETVPHILNDIIVWVQGSCPNARDTHPKLGWYKYNSCHRQTQMFRNIASCTSTPGGSSSVFTSSTHPTPLSYKSHPTQEEHLEANNHLYKHLWTSLSLPSAQLEQGFFALLKHLGLGVQGSILRDRNRQCNVFGQPATQQPQ